MREIVEHIFTRRDVHGNVIPFVGRDVGKSPLLQALRRSIRSARQQAWPASRSRSHRLNSAWGLHCGDQVIEEALLGAFEG